MNILFFLTPKINVSYINDDETLAEAMEKMEKTKYSSVPIINQNGIYIGTITEGDILWALKNDFNLNLRTTQEIPISEVKRRMDNSPVSVNANIEDLITKAMNQNFVPVIDDERTFIGIVTRKDILHFCYEKIRKNLSSK